jgi:hypothetical protein
MGQRSGVPECVQGVGSSGNIDFTLQISIPQFQARKDLDQHRDLVEKGYSRRVELAKEGAKSMEEKKAELEKMKKELDDLQPIKAGIEASKNDAEQKESNAKGEEDRKWDGKYLIIKYSLLKTFRNRRDKAQGRVYQLFPEVGRGQE